MSYDVSLFVGDLLRSCGLIALALALGGIFWAALGVRRADIPEVTKNRILDHSLRLAAIGAALVAITQGLGVMAKAQALAGALNVSPYPDFFETTAFQTGLIRTLFAALLGGAVVWLRRDHSSSLRWGAVFGAAALLITTGAWQAHGASRAQDREILMTLTVLHQLGAAVWVGGVLHLIALWRLIKKAPDLAAHPGLWPGLLARFTPIGIAAVVLIAGTGGVLAFDYVDNLNGLIGTAYGSILSVKWILAACALGFAGLV
ncbi:MAG: hypothetical protein HQ494_09465 [Rhodospirillales bacterium]|nr:hypothetical protein [Rhodospirillales bacterium]